jgi:hypothetical protein
VPFDSIWIKENGKEFHGEMICPWKNFSDLDMAQREYERQLLVEFESALSDIETALGV